MTKICWRKSIFCFTSDTRFPRRRKWKFPAKARCWERWQAEGAISPGSWLQKQQQQHHPLPQLNKLLKLILPNRQGNREDTSLEAGPQIRAILQQEAAARQIPTNSLFIREMKVMPLARTQSAQCWDVGNTTIQGESNTILKTLGVKDTGCQIRPGA